MKILLVNPLVQPSLWEDDLISNWPPLGLAYIAAVLEEEGHEVKIIERKRIAAREGLVPYTKENLEGIDRLTLAEAEAFGPDMVGLTAMTPMVMDAYRTARLLKKQGDVPIVIGGYHASFDPELTLRDCEALDIVVRGEGEVTIKEIVSGKPWEGIAGIGYRRNGHIGVNPMGRFIEDLDVLPFPARHLFDREFYFGPSAGLIRGFWARGTTIFTARGCPFECTFCQSPQYTRGAPGRAYRSFSADYVIREITHLIEDFGIEAVLFAEDIFNINRKRSVELCNKLIETGLSEKIIWAADCRVDLVTKDFLELMRRAGCVRMIFGTESGSDRTLANIKKQATVEQAVNAIRWTKEAGMTCEANIIIGLPEERPEDLLDTIRFLKKSKPDMINRGKLFPIPGTEMYYQLKERGIVGDHKDWNEIIDYYTRAEFTFADMSIKEFDRLKAKFDREVTLRRNYWFNVKTNWRRNPVYALQQAVAMVVHVAVLYLPVEFQKLCREVAESLRLKSRLVFRVG